MHRRELLKTAGGAFVASMIPRELLATGANVSPLMTTLSEYMASAGGRALPDAVVEKTKHMILDTLAAAISGSDLPPGKFAITFARTYGGEKISTVVASNVVCGPIEAALANGMLAHSDETDDTHPPSQSHPGCSVVPAALAVGEKRDIDGQRLMRAVALGYDVGTRVTATLGKLQYMADTHRSTHALAGKKRRHRGDAGRGRRHRRGRRPVGRGQLLPGVRAEERSGDGHRQARRTVRDHAHEHQEMDD